MHKDKATGVVVADVWEVVGLDGISDLFADLDTDAARWKRQLEEHLLAEVVKQIDLQSEDGVDLPPMPVVQISGCVESVKITLRGASWNGVLLALADDGIKYKYTVNYYYSSGSFYEPPEEGCEIEWERSRNVCSQ